ncbi:MAG: zinc-dependent alcohol dehydrogenase [Acidimicrobiales bacterium]
MRALVVERSLPRFAAARLTFQRSPATAASLGPLRLASEPEPALPGPGWHRLRPVLSGVCGSDLATLAARSSRYFEPLVSFPFVPGHEVLAELRRDGRTERVVVQPTLTCEARNVSPRCGQCRAGATQLCERTTLGDLPPGLQTGYCAATGGGWAEAMIAHESQLHTVPPGLGDDDAVLVEPAACAVHAVLRSPVADGSLVAVLGSGTIGLCAIAALRQLTGCGTICASAKYPEQGRLAADLGADSVVPPAELARAIRRHTGSLLVGSHLTRGADVVLDCVGSPASLEQAMSVVAPGGTICLAGMPTPARVDLTPLWHREVSLVGSYAYGTEHPEGGEPASTFDLALALTGHARLGRLVSARYPLERFADALAHAAGAGRRGAVKIVFEPRREQV